MNIDTYRTANGTKFRFGFELRENGGLKNYVVLILDQPNYGERGSNVHDTYREREGENYIISYSGPVPTLGDAKIVAASWADFTERYILTGQPFP